IRILSNWFWGKRAWRCNSTSPNTSSAALAIHDPAWHSALAMVIISPFLNSEFRTPHTAFHLYPSGPVPSALDSSQSLRFVLVLVVVLDPLLAGTILNFGLPSRSFPSEGVPAKPSGNPLKQPFSNRHSRNCIWQPMACVSYSTRKCCECVRQVLNLSNRVLRDDAHFGCFR